jgi:hypothetical protein
MNPWNLPARVCPNAWCRCTHRAPGDDDRCAACRARPEGAERHGAVRTELHGDVWNGEWGTTFTTLPGLVSERKAWRDDLALAEGAARGLTRHEIAAWLESAGAFIEGDASQLRERAVLRQMDLWLPRSFLSHDEARAHMNAVRDSEHATKAA